jgi:hypothetical protein
MPWSGGRSVTAKVTTLHQTSCALKSDVCLGPSTFATRGPNLIRKYGPANVDAPSLAACSPVPERAALDECDMGGCPHRIAAKSLACTHGPGGDMESLSRIKENRVESEPIIERTSISIKVAPAAAPVPCVKLIAARGNDP